MQMPADVALNLLGKSSLYSYCTKCDESLPIQHISSRLRVSQVQVSEPVVQLMDTYPDLCIVIPPFVLQQVPDSAFSVFVLQTVLLQVGSGIVRDQRVDYLVSGVVLVA